MPVWDWYEIPRLKASPDPREKVRYYLKIVTAFGVLTVAAGLSPGQCIYDRGADDADWTFSGDDVAGHGKSAAADGGACNVERA